MTANAAMEAETPPFQYIIGIDLGTTNSAVGYVDLAACGADDAAVRFLEIPQLVAPGELGNRPVLPSFLYLPGPYELPPGSTALPWAPERSYAVGEFAREQGALVPGRLVSSAKSWLCHGGVDRTHAILPWGASENLDRISPIEASSRILLHIREAWNEVMAHGREEHFLEEQLVVLTVPASFDEVARELTVRAAHEAGIRRIVLIEEPLAAFYAWLWKHEADWRTLMRPGQLVLVCDMGGGTSDFTVIAIREDALGLRLDRLAVGEHLMLGGDNMDLALARHVEEVMQGGTGRLDSRRWQQLWHQCRKAKETLLGTVESAGPPAERPSAPDAVDLTIVGSGGRLIAGTLTATLTRETVKELILDGFFPFTNLDDVSPPAAGAVLSEGGLPYVDDLAVTRHMAAFWRRHRPLLLRETGRSRLYPDFLLFNGGALIPETIRDRLLRVVREWFRAEAGDEWSPAELENPRPDLSVAIGAAYYGRVRLGRGVRVGAGSPRTFYVEVAPPGDRTVEEGHRSAVCLLPRGAEEGYEAELERPEFQVRTNQPVSFEVLASSTRIGDSPGQILSLPNHELTVLPPIRTALRYGRKGSAAALPVRLAVHLTDIGTLELWCRSTSGPHRWQLQFDVRHNAEDETRPPPAGETFEASRIDEAGAAIAAVFRRSAGRALRPPERLVKDLVEIFEVKRERWPASLVRKLADALLEDREGRFLTAQHEARWLNLLGFCLRPGYGDPLDEWRAKEAWKLYPAGLSFARQPQNRSEWWIFWRRAAGGLSTGQQQRICQEVFPGLQPEEQRKKGTARKGGAPRTVQEELEVWMMLANLERLPAAVKTSLGRLMLRRLQRGAPRPQELWTFARFGARVPFYGPLDQTVPREEAALWLAALLDLDLEPTQPLARTLVSLSRLTGDRARDLDRADRDRVLRRLESIPGTDHLRALLNDARTDLEGSEREWLYGESLPSGLIVVEGAGTVEP